MTDEQYTQVQYRLFRLESLILALGVTPPPPLVNALAEIEAELGSRADELFEPRNDAS